MTPAATQPAPPVRDGDPMLDFTLPAHPAGEFTLSTQRGRTVILYFYPKDDTPGCTKQACGLRDLAAELEQAGAVVVGVSKDSPASHARFAAKYHLPFTLVSDTGGALRARLGNPSGAGELIRRITYIIDGEGVVRHIVNADGKDKVPDHLAQALEWAKRLHGG